MENKKIETVQNSEILGSKATRILENQRFSVPLKVESKISGTDSTGSSTTNMVSSANLNGNNKIAVVRIRGVTGIRYDIDNTLDKLNLYKKNYCIVVPKTAVYMGMIKKVKDYVTWGDIEESTYNTLIEKRAKEYIGRVTDKKGKIKYNRFVEVNNKKIEKNFRLNSPKKGYGRKGIKVSFNSGGALGYRGDKIKDLIMRMV